MKLEILYHWSPADRRTGIARQGLVPGKRPVTHSSLPFDDASQWRAPYVCLAEDPLWAWCLSGNVSGSVGEVWDLWAINLHEELHSIFRVRHARRQPGDAPNPTRYHEWRVYDRIYKRHVRYLASRTFGDGWRGPLE